MWRVLAILVLFHTAWLRTGEPSLIFEQHRSGAYVYDHYRDIQLSELSIAYGVLFETAPLSSDLVRVETWGWPGGSVYLTHSLTLPRYDDRGRVIGAYLSLGGLPEHPQPTSYQRDVSVEPLEEMCGEVPCPYSEPEVIWAFDPQAHVLSMRTPGSSELLDAVKNGGRIDAEWEYFLGPCMTPEPCEYSAGAAAFNSRTMGSWRAEYQLESVLDLEVVYEPFTAVPEPGSASLIMIAISIVGALAPSAAGIKDSGNSEDGPPRGRVAGERRKGAGGA